MAKRTQQFRTIRTEGAILPPDILRRIASLKVDGASPGAYHLPPGSKLNEAISQSWTLLLNHWRAFQEARNQLPEDDTGTAVTNEKWLLPLFKELDYGRLVSTKSPEIDERTYPIERFYNHTPIHLIGCNLPLDRRTKGARGAATASPHSMVQEYLNRSDVHLWAFMSNGLLLRILRDNVSLSRQAYVEFDLEAMMEGEVYADFALLWLLCHQSRVETDKPEECWLEKWSGLAREQGTRVLNDLRIGVQNAIEALGRGFIGHPRNDRLREKLRSGSLTTEDYYRQLLRTVYRLLFLFVAEDRELLHPPNADSTACRLYDEHYSTRRLRDLALRIRGSKHADLWHSLSLIFDALGRNDGRPELGLCGLGSFLWRASSTADLLGPGQPANGSDADSEPVLITNDDLLQAIRALAYVEQDRTLRTVDYRNLGSEELGSVYESLLELHPVMNAEAKAFDLKTAAGNERKTTGSYYTPDSLVQCLLDSALDPLVEERLTKNKGKEAEAALLDLKICDPACGSGHFLIAAAHRLARHLARVRTGESEPSPDDYQRALRDVIGRSIYGVDINPMAVELCKVSMWVEALEPGRPLTFLDHHVKCGNSLIGVTPRLIDDPLPDDAFTAIEGDVKQVCSELKKRNKEERTGKGGFLFDLKGEVRPWDALGNLPAAFVNLDEMPEDSVDDIRAKEDRYAEAVGSVAYENARLLADAWCSAFVWVKNKETDDAVTQSWIRRIEHNPHSLTPWMKTEIRRLAKHYRFFHPHLSFPDVFRLPGSDESVIEHTGWLGGFDLMLGNPPWDTLSPDLKEFFARYDPQVRFSDKEAQQAIVAELCKDAKINSAWEENRRDLYASVHFIKRSGRFRLFAKGNLGKGDFNVYRMFVETALDWTRPSGRAAQLTPENLYNGPNAAAIRKHLYEECELQLLLGFENLRGIWFPDIDGRTKFCLYVSSICGITTRFPTAFRIASLADLSPTTGPRLFMDVRLIREVSPAALAIPELDTQEAVDVSVKIYDRWPKFGDTKKWFPVREYMREVDMGTNRDLFNSDGDGLPVYEGRMVAQFDHRAKGYVSGRGRSAVWDDYAFRDSRKGIQPQWWIAEDKLPEKVLNRVRSYRIGFCDVTSPTNERSLVAAIIPPHTVAGDKVPTLMFKNSSPWHLVSWLAVANSFGMDYLIRRKVSLKMSYTTLDSMPFPTFSSEMPRIRRCVELSARLACCGSEMASFWNQLAQDGWVPTERIVIEEQEERLCARAELDAIIARDFLGLTESEMAFVLQDFPTTAKYEVARWGTFRSRELILQHFRQTPATAEVTALQIDRGRAVAYTTLLLRMWTKPVARNVLEPALILMLNDAIRKAILGQKASTKQGATAAATTTIVAGMNQFLGGLEANRVIAVKEQNSQQFISVGSEARRLDQFPQGDKTKATETIQALSIIGESRALTYIKAMLDEAGQPVPHFAAD